MNTHISRWVVCILTTQLLHFHTWIFFWDSQRWFQSHTHRYWETGTVGWEFKWKAFLVLGALQLHMVFEQHATFWILGELQSLYVSLQKAIRSSDSGFNRIIFCQGTSFLFQLVFLQQKKKTGNEHGRKRRRKVVKVMSPIFKASMIVLFPSCWVSASSFRHHHKVSQNKTGQMGVGDTTTYSIPWEDEKLSTILLYHFQVAVSYMISLVALDHSRQCWHYWI